MKSIFFTCIFLFVACSSPKINKVLWDGTLIEKNEDLNYLSWSDGNQFYTQYNDSFTVSVAGFAYYKNIYIIMSITNDTERPVTFFLRQCSLLVDSSNTEIALEPIRPKNLDDNDFSFFKTLLSSAGSISKLFINIPSDIQFGSKDKDEIALENLGHDYQDEKIDITKKIFINNHTLFPGSSYAGFMVFKNDENKVSRSFKIKVEVNGNTFFSEGILN